ncbi:unnamed protein product [Leptidea sinapis]|uniref:DUF4773 domain-containing protein n=1 Tax=Leptidea sinapis TaxID=189913 RepID=A0A5E4QCM2_9NEOP|nr:unnamed protein product [Leptidea sinapis]
MTLKLTLSLFVALFAVTQAASILGCVHMKYLSPDDGFSVNVSYGKNLLHSSKIQVFGKFAQVCAKFSELAPTSDGLRGCLELEPKLLGEAQLEFPIGCFKSSPGGMEMEDPPEKPAEEVTTEASATEETTFDAESFLESVYQTAEQGVAFLSSLLDIPSRRNLTTTIKPQTLEEQNQRRVSKTLKHPNQL